MTTTERKRRKAISAGLRRRARVRRRLSKKHEAALLRGPVWKLKNGARIEFGPDRGEVYRGSTNGWTDFRGLFGAAAEPVAPPDPIARLIRTPLAWSKPAPWGSNVLGTRLENAKLVRRVT